MGMTTEKLLAAIDEWGPEGLTYLKEGGESAPEYDLETARGIERLREDCKERAATIATGCLESRRRAIARPRMWRVTVSGF